MPNPAPSSALREWRDHLGQPQLWVALAGVAILVAMVGPFDTDEVLSIPGRLGYWGIVVPACYVIGAFCSIMIAPVLRGRVPNWMVTVLAGSATGLLIYLFVIGLNALLFGLRPGVAEIPRSLLLFLTFSVVISFLLGMLPTRRGSGEPTDTTPPPILDRLPLEKRGALIALSVEDHYVRIRTAKGAEMVLMRLTDAIREVGATPGLRVHRSHWVATSQVTGAARRGDGAILTLSDGTEVPVSRANMAAIREVGLLPR